MYPSRDGRVRLTATTGTAPARESKTPETQPDRFSGRAFYVGGTPRAAPRSWAMPSPTRMMHGADGGSPAQKSGPAVRGTRRAAIPGTCAANRASRRRQAFDRRTYSAIRPAQVAICDSLRRVRSVFSHCGSESSLSTQPKRPSRGLFDSSIYQPGNTSTGLTSTCWLGHTDPKTTEQFYHRTKRETENRACQALDGLHGAETDAQVTRKAKSGDSGPAPVATSGPDDSMNADSARSSIG